MGNYSNYKIEAEVKGSELIPVSLKVPVDAMVDNCNDVNPYFNDKRRFCHLGVYGIPNNIEWEAYLTEIILPHTKLDSSLLVEKILNIEVDKDRNLCIDCLVEDSCKET